MENQLDEKKNDLFLKNNDDLFKSNMYNDIGDCNDIFIDDDEDVSILDENISNIGLLNCPIFVDIKININTINTNIETLPNEVIGAYIKDDFKSDIRYYIEKIYNEREHGDVSKYWINYLKYKYNNIIPVINCMINVNSSDEAFNNPSYKYILNYKYKDNIYNNDDDAISSEQIGLLNPNNWFENVNNIRFNGINAYNNKSKKIIKVLSDYKDVNGKFIKADENIKYSYQFYSIRENKIYDNIDLTRSISEIIDKLKIDNYKNFISLKKNLKDIDINDLSPKDYNIFIDKFNEKTLDLLEIQIKEKVTKKNDSRMVDIQSYIDKCSEYEDMYEYFIDNYNSIVDKFMNSVKLYDNVDDDNIEIIMNQIMENIKSSLKLSLIVKYDEDGNVDKVYDMYTNNYYTLDEYKNIKKTYPTYFFNMLKNNIQKKTFTQNDKLLNYRSNKIFHKALSTDDIFIDESVSKKSIIRAELISLLRSENGMIRFKNSILENVDKEITEDTISIRINGYNIMCIHEYYKYIEDQKLYDNINNEGICKHCGESDDSLKFDVGPVFDKNNNIVIGVQIEDIINNVNTIKFDLLKDYIKYLLNKEEKDKIIKEYINISDSINKYIHVNLDDVNSAYLLSNENNIRSSRNIYEKHQKSIKEEEKRKTYIKIDIMKDIISKVYDYLLLIATINLYINNNNISEISIFQKLIDIELKNVIIYYIKYILYADVSDAEKYTFINYTTKDIEGYINFIKTINNIQSEIKLNLFSSSNSYNDIITYLFIRFFKINKLTIVKPIKINERSQNTYNIVSSNLNNKYNIDSYSTYNYKTINGTKGIILNQFYDNYNIKNKSTNNVEFTTNFQFKELSGCTIINGANIKNNNYDKYINGEVNASVQKLSSSYKNNSIENYNRTLLNIGNKLEENVIEKIDGIDTRLTSVVKENKQNTDIILSNIEDVVDLDFLSNIDNVEILNSREDNSIKNNINKQFINVIDNRLKEYYKNMLEQLILIVMGIIQNNIESDVKFGRYINYKLESDVEKIQYEKILSSLKSLKINECKNYDDYKLLTYYIFENFEELINGTDLSVKYNREYIYTKYEYLFKTDEYYENLILKYYNKDKKSKKEEEDNVYINTEDVDVEINLEDQVVGYVDENGNNNEITGYADM